MIDRGKVIHKAYRVTDRKGYSDYSVIVFADTPGRAVSRALGTDEFQIDDWDFTELRAIRIPTLDASYHGKSVMDWDNMSDRVAMVKAGFFCDPDCITLDDCKACPAKDWCSEYEREFLENED